MKLEDQRQPTWVSEQVETEPQQSTSEIVMTWVETKQIIALTGGFIGWGAFVSSAVLIVQLAFSFAPLNRKADDGMQTMWGVTEHCIEEGRGLLGSIWCYDFQAGALPRTIAVDVVFFGPFLLPVVPLSAKETIALLSLAATSHLVMFFILLHPVKSIRTFWSSAWFALSFLPPIFWKLIRPKQPVIWKAATVCLSVSAVGLFFLQLYFKVSSNGAAFALVAIPFLRFLLITLGTTLIYTLQSNPKTLRTLRRNYIQSLLVFPYCFLSIWSRMAITSITDTKSLVIYLAASSGMELVSRLTLQWRYNLFKKTMSRLPSYHNMRAVTPSAPSLQVPEKKESKAAKVEKIIKFMILYGTIAEYIGLFMNFGSILLYQNQVLKVPLAFYSEQDDPFSGTFANLDLLKQFTLQFAIEIVTDITCFMLEDQRFGWSKEDLWRSIPFKVKAISLLLGTFCSANIAISSILSADLKCSVDSDWGNPCTCSYAKESVYGKYCSKNATTT